MRSRCFTAAIAILVVLGVLPCSAQATPASGVEKELQSLSRATTRLVESLERRELDQLSDRDLLQVQVGVRLLDIRVRQQETLQKRLDNLENRQRRLDGSIAANEVKVENLNKQIAEAIDESQKLERESARALRVVYLKNQRDEIEDLAQRRAELEGRLIEGERFVADIEDLVQQWVTETQADHSE